MRAIREIRDGNVWWRIRVGLHSSRWEYVVIMARTGFPPLFHSSPLSVTVARRLPHGGPDTQRCAKLRVRLTAIPTSDVNFTVEARSR